MNNPNSESDQGDILYGKNNKNIFGKAHYIIYLGPDPSSSDLFLGAMLTHSPRFSNIQLQKDHFEIYDSAGTPYKVLFNRSFISCDLYHKRVDWAPFKKVGQLSKKGIEFIIKNIGEKHPIFYPNNKKNVN